MEIVAHAVSLDANSFLDTFRGGIGAVFWNVELVAEFKNVQDVRSVINSLAASATAIANARPISFFICMLLLTSTSSDQAKLGFKNLLFRALENQKTEN
jgi:hypothetical protein